LLATAIGAGTTTALYSAGRPHHPVVNSTAISGSGYRFYDHFCRVQYNNPADRNACMIQATGIPLANSERDDR
jgi:hypothetical protein